MFGIRLKALRKERRLTLDDISGALGFTRSTYAGYEQEYRKPPLDSLEVLANYHNVSVDYILGLTNDRDPKKVETNMEEYLKKGDLNWGGVPLTDEELKPIRDLLEMIVRDRLPHDINTNKKSRQ